MSLVDAEKACQAPSLWLADTSESGASADIEENNLHRLAQRQKQIDYGKNTAGYQSYREKVPKWVALLLELVPNSCMKYFYASLYQSVCSAALFAKSRTPWSHSTQPSAVVGSVPREGPP